jgi:hypothetical protein
MSTASRPSYISMPGMDYFLLYMDVVEQDDLKNSLPFQEYYQRLHEIKSNYKGIDGVFCSGFIPDTQNFPVTMNHSSLPFC